MIKLKLDEMLREKNMTAYALHIKSGLHQSVISKIKRNMSKALQLDVLDTLCKALECQPGDLMTCENEDATQGVNTQIVNTTQIVERATQNVKQSAPVASGRWAELQAVRKPAKGKKPKQETLTAEDFAPSKSFDNDLSHNYSVLEIVNSSSDNEYTLTTKDAGELLGLNPRTVRENAEKGLLHGKQGKQSHWFFRRSDIDGFISRRG
jgi:putative transcriptional regulator